MPYTTMVSLQFYCLYWLKFSKDQQLKLQLFKTSKSLDYWQCKYRTVVLLIQKFCGGKNDYKIAEKLSFRKTILD